MVAAASHRLRAARRVMMRSCPICAWAEWNWTATLRASPNGDQQSRRRAVSNFQAIGCPSQNWIDLRAAA